jgi:hypothetical protein
MIVCSKKLSLLSVIVSAALAGCGGGGDTAATPTPGTPTPGTPTPGTPAPGTPAPTPTPPVVVTPGVTPVIPAVPGLPTAPTVPPANIVSVEPATPTYTAGSDALRSFTLANVFRREAQGGASSGVVEGSGAVSQIEPLDDVAAKLKAFLEANPGSIGTAAARLEAQRLGGLSGLAYTYSASFDTGTLKDENGFVLPLIQGDFCAKSVFSSVFDLEQMMSGVRSIGVAVPVTPPAGTTPVVGGYCVLTVGQSSLATWQLPATGSVAVYPHPDKPDTLKSGYANLNEPGLTGFLGHPVFASVSSIDALAVDVPGVGSKIDPAQIVLQRFTLTAAASASGAAGPVSARVLAPRGTNIAAVGNAQYTDNFSFPTSLALIPTEKLRDNTEYTATISATVRGRPVSATWKFSTGTY